MCDRIFFGSRFEILIEVKINEATRAVSFLIIKSRCALKKQLKWFVLRTSAAIVVLRVGKVGDYDVMWPLECSDRNNETRTMGENS